MWISCFSQDIGLDISFWPTSIDVFSYFSKTEEIMLPDIHQNYHARVLHMGTSNICFCEEKQEKYLYDSPFYLKLESPLCFNKQVLR